MTMIKTNSNVHLEEYIAPEADVFALHIKRTILSLSNTEGVGGKNEQDIDWGE